MAPVRVAVVGAGMAGLACAGALHAAGCEVVMFDKGRRPGGRLATRRVGDLRFDHGAQYATAKGAAFQAFLASAADLIVPWDGAAAHQRWVGVPGMSAFATVAERLGYGTLMARRQVMFLSRDSAGWRLRHLDAAANRPGVVSDEGEHAGPFDRLVLALPPAQAAGLLDAVHHPFAPSVARVVMEPCWALMLAFDARMAGADTASLRDGALSWIARDSSRPGRASLPDSWVAHASPAWSRAHLQDAPQSVAAELHQAFAAATGIDAHPMHRAVHRWRYAHATKALDQDCLWDPDGLAVCGDWCLGARVEAAFDSGKAAAGRCSGFG